ncbi:MAG TPA: transglycosylase domain-containing protein [Thermoanaerobaculia bacterium]|nr:transglycosylase domain-containing protein [Thermoanaerobaculia bacterium]
MSVLNNNRVKWVAAGLLDLLDREGRRLGRVAARPAVERSFGACLAAAGAVLVALALVFVAIAREVWPSALAFGSYGGSSPSRLFAEPLELSTGGPEDAELIVRYLNDLEFLPVAELSALRPGRYFLERFGGSDGSASTALTLWARQFSIGSGESTRRVVPSRRIVLVFSERSVDEIVVDGERTESALLEPVELMTYYGSELRDRRPVTLEQVPQAVVRAVLAAEDAAFFEHGGVSLPGTIRAAWVNFRRGRIAQGGSTITQQLARTLYLDSSRTFHRKGREAVLANLIEQRYPKSAILEAYLNESYWGVRDGVSVIGLGAAARTWFGKDPIDLDLAEAALLAGMIQAPGRYLPNVRPAAALARREWVLDRLARLGWIGSAERDAAAASELVLAPGRPPRRARYFADAVAEEARRRFGLEELGAAGFTLHSTLRWRDQLAAEDAMSEGLSRLEERWARQPAHAPPLQGSLLSVDPRTGAVLAYVGGREYSGSQFDRVQDARRQIGSLFKPIVYAAAFAGTTVGPNDLVRDEPLTVRYEEEVWSPRNSQGRYHGPVTLRRALEASLNAATVRLAVHTGLDMIADQARALGLPLDAEVGPSMVLGASAASSWQVASAYSVLANRGRQVPLHGLLCVVDPDGSVLERELEAHDVVSERAAFLVTSLLQGVVVRGTARQVRSLGLEDPVAGKTGTSNEGRDGWFAGYSSERATVVWVGYDDNRATRLTGTRGALPLWTRFSLEVRPAGGYAQTPSPPGFVQAWVDPTSGGLASMTCPSRILEYLPVGAAEVSPCPLHSHHVANTTMTAALEPGSSDSNEIVAAARRSAALSIVRAFGAARAEAGTSTATSSTGIAVLQRSGLVGDGVPSEGVSGRWILIASPAEQTEVLELDGPLGRLLRVVPAAASARQL